jgi:hypothetical protein
MSWLERLHPRDGVGRFAAERGVRVSSHDEKSSLWRRVADPGSIFPGARTALIHGDRNHIVVGFSPHVPDAQLHKVAAITEQLHARHPVRGPLLVTVEDQHRLSNPEHLAESTPGAGFVRLSADVFNDKAYARRMTKTRAQLAAEKAAGETGGHFMPAAAGVDRVRYLLTHEWGHITDTGPAKGSRARFRQHTADLSQYGRRSVLEARAEAFAEWELTKGATTNPAARAYAAAEGWKGAR